MNFVDKARLVATTAHMAANHFRKISNVPYISHPKEVAYFAGMFADIQNIPKDVTNFMIAAAWLHDTVEDTGLTLEYIKEEFPAEVFEIVDALTDEKHESLSRGERLDAYIMKLGKGPRAALIVKIADIRSNFNDIRASFNQPDPKMQFKKYERFIREKSKIIAELGLDKFAPGAKLLEDMNNFLASRIAMT